MGTIEPSAPFERARACLLASRENAQIGAAVDTAQWGEVAKLDEEAAEYNEALADLFIAVLVDSGLVEPLIADEGS